MNCLQQLYILYVEIIFPLIICNVAAEIRQVCSLSILTLENVIFHSILLEKGAFVNTNIKKYPTREFQSIKA